MWASIVAAILELFRITINADKKQLETVEQNQKTIDGNLQAAKDGK